MSNSIFLLGRQPSLGAAELEAVFGAEKVTPAGPAAALVAVDADAVPFDKLGGSLKFGEVLETVASASWPDLERALERIVPPLADYIDGKLKLGISVYGLSIPPARINTTGLRLKKHLKAAGHSVRVVPNQKPDLNSAQVLHNQLTGKSGIEILVIRDGQRTIIAQTKGVQDIEAYAARDQARPMRDARVGMLPPKLAQIMLNLAQISSGMRVLDPFCGTGVVLQEAGLNWQAAVYGTDLDERMVRYTRDNINWLQETFSLQLDWFVETGDATSHTWRPPIDRVACETYLGRPLSSLPAPEVLQKIVSDCNVIHKKFLANLADQTQSGFRACIAVPAWQIRPDSFKHLPLLDQLQELGYNRIRFVHVETKDLIYYRPDQIVARELVVLERK